MTKAKRERRLLVVESLLRFGERKARRGGRERHREKRSGSLHEFAPYERRRRPPPAS